MTQLSNGSGLTLRERLRLVAHSPADCSAGRERVELWRSWFNRGPDGVQGWDNFLAENSLSESRLVQLENLFVSETALPHWCRTLQNLRNYLAKAVPDFDETRSPAENFVSPLVDFALPRVSSLPNCGLLSAAALSSLAQWLRRRLEHAARPVIDWELAAAGADRPLRADPPRKAALPPLVRVLEDYPALSRLWALQIETWIRFVEEFLGHARTFRAHRGKAGSPVIASLQAGLSDPHNGHRSVMHVCFKRGDEWFYKPRSGRMERAWFDLLAWFNDERFPLRFQIPEMQCHARHCWMRSVHPRRCENRKEGADFCFRFGALMCLLHVLRGVDMHPGNIIACGDQPVVVDCETLLHPDTFLPDEVRAEDDSIVRTGLLPAVSGLPASTNLAPEKILRSLRDGFRAMTQHLRKPRASARLREWARACQSLPVRRIYRPTAHYYEMLGLSLAPSLLDSGLERSLFLHACCRQMKDRLRESEEVEALEDGDIPWFHGQAAANLRLDLSEETVTESISRISRALGVYHKTQVQR